MKRLFSAAVTAFLLLFAFSLAAHAAEYDFYGGEVSDDGGEYDLGGVIDELPDGVKDEAADIGAATDSVGRAAALRDKLTPSYWWRAIVGWLKDALFGAVPSVTAILGVLILSSLVGGLAGEGGTTATRTFSVLSSAAVALEVTRAAASTVETVTSYVTRLCAMMNAMLPVMNAIYISSGRVTQAAVNSSALMTYVTVTENLAANFLAPAAGALLALVCASAIAGRVNVSPVVETLKKGLMIVITFLTVVFSFVMGIQSSLAAGADSLAMRAVRFAVEGTVPIVGGAVSEAVTTVGASLSLIRKVSGAAGIVLILLILLPALITLCAVKLSLFVCRAAADLLGCDGPSAVIGAASDALSVFAALAALSGVMFIFAVTLFMNSGTVA